MRYIRSINTNLTAIPTLSTSAVRGFYIWLVRTLAVKYKLYGNFCSCLLPALYSAIKYSTIKYRSDILLFRWKLELFLRLKMKYIYTCVLCVINTNLSIDRDWNFYTEYVNRVCCITCINIQEIVNTWCRLIADRTGECKQLGRQERELGGMMGGYQQFRLK